MMLTVTVSCGKNCPFSNQDHKKHALERSWLGSEQVASWAVVVDAKVGARDFYLKHDFIPLPSQPDRLVLPIQTIEQLFSA
jgi:hypothetical protein